MNDCGMKDEAPIVKSDVDENETPSLKDGYLQKLDGIERRVEQFRLQAQALEQERIELLQDLEDFQIHSAVSCEISEEMKEEIEVNTERLIFRCLTVDVSVVTPRTPAQEGALERVELSVRELEDKLKHDEGSCSHQDHHKLLSYLNACLPEQARGPTDHKFQGILLQCTADDQKQVRRKLQLINSKFTESQKTPTGLDTHGNISGTVVNGQVDDDQAEDS